MGAEFGKRRSVSGNRPSPLAVDGSDCGRAPPPAASMAVGMSAALAWVSQTHRYLLLGVLAFPHMILKSFVVFLQFYYLYTYFIIFSFR